MNRDTEHTSTATLEFLRSELLYDISTIGFVEADIMNPQEEHAQHQTFDIAEDGNIDRVTRILSLAFSECVERLYPFTKTPVEERETRDDVLKVDVKYVMTLDLPSTFAKSTLDLLEKYIHEYLICRVLAWWFSITKPNSAANWKAKADEAMEGIVGAKSIRIKKVRRGMSIF